MYKIFDLEKPEFYIYKAALDDAINSTTDPELRSIAINLRHDHRVSEAHELEFREYFKKFKFDIKKALFEYCIEKVIKAETPSFCQPCIADYSGGSCLCPPDFDPNLQLATVLTFHKFRERIRDHMDETSIVSDLWDTGLVEARDDSREFGNWLDSHLLNPDGSAKDPHSAEVKKFIKDFFELINFNLRNTSGDYNEFTRIKPFWVTDWAKLKTYTNLGTDRWNQVVGVWREYKTWQIVITYPASAVDVLYRPTQLDGGYYPQHFPPPRGVSSAEGGYTMDWGTPDDVLMPEFIHKQIELKYEYWANADYRIGKTSILPCDLQQSRFAHYEKLKKQFNVTELGDWMSTPF